MVLLYSIIFFILGICMGSFFGVVGTRLPNKESIIKPNSYCNNCKKELAWYNLIPLLSFVIQGGKCSFCKTKLSIKYFLYELLTGILYVIGYLIFDLSPELIIYITFVSTLVIVIISDIEYMIILDEVLIIGSILLVIELFIFKDLNFVLISLLSAVISFLGMWGIKLLGDFIFKKESMGGGDIKLMFLIGLLFSLEGSLLTIFISSFIALPYAFIVLIRKKENIVPYGPFISIAAILLFCLKLNDFNLNMLIELIS